MEKGIEMGTEEDENRNEVETKSEKDDATTTTYTLDEAIDSIGYGWFHVRLTFICSLGMMADSVMIMVLAVLSAQLKCLWNLTPLQETLISTITFVGYAFGALLWGWTADKFGRKKILMGSISLMCAFTLISALAYNYPSMLVCRLLVGLGAGGLGQCMILPAEVMPVQSRGKNSMFILLFWSIGALYVAGIAFLIPIVGWRWFNVFSAFPPLIFLMLSYWLPESTRYLVLTGRHDDATYQLQQAASMNNTQLPPGKLETTVATEVRGSFSHLLSREWRMTSLLLWWMWFGVQFTYYGMSLYTTEVLQSGLNGCHPHVERMVVPGNLTNASITSTCKLLTSSDYLDLMWTTGAELPGFVVAIALIEPIGRKATLALCLIIASLFFVLQVLCTAKVTTMVLLFVSRAFIAASSDLMYVYTPEVYPTDIRSTGLGVSACLARTAACLTPFVAQVLTQSSFYATVALYSALLFTCGGAALLLPIETRGKALVEDSNKGAYELLAQKSDELDDEDKKELVNDGE